MTQPNSETDHNPPAPRPARRAVSAFGFILLVAAAGAGYYYTASRSSGLRAQEPSLHDTASFYTVEGARITVPPTSPLRTRLDIAEIQNRSISRNLTLPAVVEADPARTAKVLPPVAGRVTELKVQLGARVNAGDVLAVIESSDLAQAVSDLEKARSALKLTKQTLDRLLNLEKTSAIAVKDREQAQSDNAQAHLRVRAGPKSAPGDRRSARPQGQSAPARDQGADHRQRDRFADGARRLPQRPDRCR